MVVKAGGEGGECNERHSICYGEDGKKFSTHKVPRPPAHPSGNGYDKSKFVPIHAGGRIGGVEV